MQVAFMAIFGSNQSLRAGDGSDTFISVYDVSKAYTLIKESICSVGAKSASKIILSSDSYFFIYTARLELCFSWKETSLSTQSNCPL